MKKIKSKKDRSGLSRAKEANVLEEAERLLAAGQYIQSISRFSSVAEDSPNFGRACKGRGAALVRMSRFAEALPVLQAAHLALPEDADILVDGADVARLMGGLDVAEDTYKEARKLGANGFQIGFGEASVHQERNRWLEAVASWAELNSSYPGNPFVLHNLGKAWHELGETDKAMTYMTEAFNLGGELATLSTLALLAPHAGGCHHEEIKDIRVRLGEQLQIQEGRPQHIPFRTKGDQKINVGYVSAFFHRQNWMKPVWSLLNNQNREKFKLHLFADGPADQINARGGYVAHPDDKIFDTRKQSNRELAKLIGDCEIDVLVDLNSYSAIRRLGLWAAKPAPVTIGWFNLYATSGMPGIEWLIGDDIVIQPEEEDLYSEKIVRLRQSYLTFQVGYDTPDIRIPGSDEPFTYGCLGSGYKITPEVRECWITILRETRDARLLVRNRVFKEESHLRWFLQFFTDSGIDPKRILLLGPAEHHEFLETYGKIDLALDTFPYNGGTTTMEALWQGVPVVCFNGDRWISRTSATLLHSAELTEFIAQDTRDYVDLAVRWSSTENRGRLRKMRTILRTKLQNSKVCDGVGLAKDFERIVFEIIREANMLSLKSNLK